MADRVRPAPAGRACEAPRRLMGTDTRTHTHAVPRASVAWVVLDALVVVAAVTAGALLGEYLVREWRARRLLAEVDRHVREAAAVPVFDVRVPRAAPPDTAEPAAEPAAEE